jgi:hypothetical protein
MSDLFKKINEIAIRKLTAVSLFDGSMKALLNISSTFYSESLYLHEFIADD